MADTTKRIIDLQTITELAADSYVMIDGAVTGTKKYLLKDMDDAIKDIESGTSLDDGAVSTHALADGAVTNAKMDTNAVATANIQNGAVTLDKIASGSEATTLASGLMSSTDKTKLDNFEEASHYALKSEIAGAYIYRGSVSNESALPASGQKTGDVYNIIAPSSYGQAGANVAWNGSAWDALGETFEIGDGSVTTSKLNGGAVTTAKLADGSVTTVKLDAGAVTEPKIGTAAVTTNKLGSGVVTTEKVNDGAITTGKLATGSVVTAKIADGNITADKLASNSVTTAKITDSAVTTAKINDGAVATSKLATSSVVTAKIADGNVTADKIGSGAVTTVKIADSNVTTAKLANSAVTTVKIADSNVTTAKIADANVTTAKIADSNVTTAKLAAGAVTSAKVAADAIAAANIQNDAVTTDKIVDGAVTRDKFDDDVVDELDFKADIDGYYAQLTAGAADNLTGRGDATTAEFMYRTAGGTADIETGQAVAKSIKGNTRVWNQLFLTLNSISASGITMTANGDGSYTLNGTATANFVSASSYNIELVVGHKYLVNGSRNGVTVQLYREGANNAPSIFTATYDAYIARVVVYSGNTVNNVTVWPQLFDLTAMFGAGNEPSTVAEFEALFPETYYEYDTGSLLSVNMTGIETTGFNQWDEEWEQGALNHTTGEKMANVSTIRSKNFIPVFPSTEYCANAPGSFAAPHYYDADKNYIGYELLNRAVGTFTTPANCRYIRFNTSITYGATYKGDICINLSWSGRRNGEYEPFWSSQRLIDVATYFPNGMRSAGTVYDELTSTEAITRVGVVDLGEVTWTYVNNSFRASRIDIPIAPLSDNIDAPRVICPLYTPVAYNTSWNVDGTCAQELGSSGRLVLINSSYTDAAAFKTAMSGVMLYYELATPTVTTIDPVLNLSYKVDDFGTERVMVPEDERSAPPVLDIAYGLNVVDFVRRAPTQYISAASFAQYLLARDAHDGTTTTMTWDDTNNRYEFTITDVETEG